MDYLLYRNTSVLTFPAMSRSTYFLSIATVMTSAREGKKKKEEKSFPNRDVVSLSSENGEPLRDHRNGHGKLCLCFENNLAFHPPNLIPVRVNASPMKYKQTVTCNPKQTPVPYTYLHVSKHHC